MEADMMVQALFALLYIGGIFLLLGVGYPLVAIAVYPLYKMAGGNQTFKEYIHSL